MSHHQNIFKASLSHVLRKQCGFLTGSKHTVCAFTEDGQTLDCTFRVAKIKGADRVRSYREADLCLRFCIGKIQFSLDVALLDGWLPLKSSVLGNLLKTLNDSYEIYCQ